MTTRDRFVVLAIAAGLVLAIAWFGVIAPEQKKAQAAASSLESVRAELVSAQRQAADARALAAKFKEAKRSDAVLRVAVPEQPAVPQLIDEIDTAAEHHSVQFASIAAERSRAGAGAGAARCCLETADRSERHEAHQLLVHLRRRLLRIRTARRAPDSADARDAPRKALRRRTSPRDRQRAPRARKLREKVHRATSNSREPSRSRRSSRVAAAPRRGAAGSSTSALRDARRQDGIADSFGDGGGSNP